MKKLVLTLVVLNPITVFVNNNANAQDCATASNIYTFNHAGRTYEVVKEMKNWTDAAACAVQRGGYLVHIGDLAEQTAVYNGIIAAGVSKTYTTVNDGGGIAYIWIGATDKTTEGTWTWDGDNADTVLTFWTGQGSAGSGGGSAAPGAFHNWGGKQQGGAKEPDNYGNNQDAGALALANWPSGSTPPTSLGVTSEWNDIATTNLLYYVIEKSPVGLTDIDVERRILVYPNPARSRLYLNLLNTDIKVYDLYIRNIVGEVVMNMQNISEKSIELDIRHLPVGTYQIEIASDRLLIRKKVIKQ